MGGAPSSDIKDIVPQEDAGSGHQEVREDAKAEGEGASTISHPISPLPGKKEENEDQAAGGMKEKEA